MAAKIPYNLHFKLLLNPKVLYKMTEVGIISLEFICNKWNLCRQRTEIHTDLLFGFHTSENQCKKIKSTCWPGAENKPNNNKKEMFTFTDQLKVIDPSNTIFKFLYNL